MIKAEEIGRENKFWVPYSQWDGEMVKQLWSTICGVSLWQTESIALNLEIYERLYCDTTNELVVDRKQEGECTAIGNCWSIFGELHQ